MELFTLKSIHSGFQTGVDTGAIIAANLLDIPTGGWACNGWCTEAGYAREWIESMGGKECIRPGYPARTEVNVRDSNATLILSHERKLTGGTYQTLCVAEALDRPWKQGLVHKNGRVELLDSSLELVPWLNLIECRVLNVAGPRDSKCPGIGDRVCRWLVEQLG